MIDADLAAALRAIHQPRAWVPLAVSPKSGWPHVTPTLMAVRDDALLFSISGPVKKRILARDPRVCFEIAATGDFKHVIVWGTMTIHTDEPARLRWREMVVDAFGETGSIDPNQHLSPDHNVLGVMTPTKWRIFRLP